MVKLRIVLPECSWHSFKAETVWATMLEDNLYRLENTPFFADNVSYHDIVFAWYDEERDALIVKSVQQRSGNSTFRIILADGIPYETFCTAIEKAQQPGCTYEGYKNYQFALNIPPAVDVKDVIAVLKDGEKAGTWYFEPSHVFDAGEQL
ncbi:MAG TPA: DUF4265 domain-containing protein [Chitinophagaceae bacterium]|nr:DUF4265 domain-containing protein [Chitinophagaceae bacterium]